MTGGNRSLWRPEVLLPATFLGAILIGSGVLMLPGMSRGVTYLDALFTSTSAVCVTGLNVVDTGTVYTQTGQIAVLSLIQLGGLGIMTFSLLGMTIVGRRASLRNEAAVKEGFTAFQGWKLGRLLAAVIGITAGIEAAGFVLLWGFLGDPWSACFHSISAFCNAGFGLRPDSLAGFPPLAVVTIMVLLILGGLGFTTILELLRSCLPRQGGGRRFSLHARIVLTTTIIFLGFGAIFLTITDPSKYRHALFMSASARTAGFETTPVGQLSDAALLVLIFLMFVGASPGSTGGGIKTTTFALAVLLVRSILIGRDRVAIYGREIPRDLLRRMFAVITCSLMVVAGGIFLIDIFQRGQPQGFLPLSFEVVSAFGTVGLSTGITPGLLPSSKLLICAIMFIGRVGSISLFLLLVRETARARVHYPEERVMIG